MRRILTLAPERPSLTIRAEFANNRNKAQRAQVRSHLSLDLGDVQTSRVRFTDKARRTVDEDMTDVIAGLREGKSFYNNSCPAGSWTFSGGKGIEVVERFDAATVDFVRLCAYPADVNELEVELWNRSVTVQPGEVAHLEHELEIRGAP
jgi:hypothetical protein